MYCNEPMCVRKVVAGLDREVVVASGDGGARKRSCQWCTLAGLRVHELVTRVEREFVVAKGLIGQEGKPRDDAEVYKVGQI